LGYKLGEVTKGLSGGGGGDEEVFETMMYGNWA